MVDRNALRTNQVFIIALTGLAFVLSLPWLTVGVGVVMLLGTLDGRLALFQQMYRRLLVPAGLLRPLAVAEDPAAPRFAQGLGGSVLLLAGLAFALGLAGLGWALSLVVIALALVNLLFNFCVGCFIYFQLERAGLLGRSGAAR